MAKQPLGVWDLPGQGLITPDRALDRALDLLNRIRDALGTEETGENLVKVASDAHIAEQELAGLKRNWTSE